MVARHSILLLLLGLLLCAWPSEVFAARKALFLLDNFEHWLDFSYQFEGSKVDVKASGNLTLKGVTALGNATAPDISSTGPIVTYPMSCGTW